MKNYFLSIDKHQDGFFGLKLEKLIFFLRKQPFYGGGEGWGIFFSLLFANIVILEVIITIQ